MWDSCGQFAASRLNQDELFRRTESQTRLMLRRGPDDEGYWTDRGGVRLGSGGWRFWT